MGFKGWKIVMAKKLLQQSACQQECKKETNFRMITSVKANEKLVVLF